MNVFPPRLDLEFTVHGITNPITVEQGRDAVRWDRHRTIMISHADRVGSLHREPGPLFGGVANLHLYLRGLLEFFLKFLFRETSGDWARSS
jgi:hypothetical protein